MNTLALLQNQYMPDPAYTQKLIDLRGERYRRLLVQFALFRGCRTGQRLRKAFGHSVGAISWDNISPRVGDKSSSSFPADLEHVQRLIDDYQPKIILAFGRPAQKAVERVRHDAAVIAGPHPAARLPDIQERINAMATEYRRLR